MKQKRQYTVEYHGIYVALKNIEPQDRLVLDRLLKPFQIVTDLPRRGKKFNKFRKQSQSKPANYYLATRSLSEIHLHTAFSKRLLLWLTGLGYSINDIELKQIPIHRTDSVSVKMNPKFKPRDYQEPYINWILNSDYHNLLELKPGDGKTFMGTYVSSQLGYRTVIIVRAMWVDKWYNDILELTRCKPEDIVTVAGKSQLTSLFEEYLHGSGNHKYIIISNKTMQNFIKAFEEAYDPYLDWEYPIYPDEYMATLRAGMLMVDEAHLDFNLNYKILMCTSCYKYLAMSGTYTSDKPQLRFIEEAIFPPDKRMAAREREKFVHVTAVKYHYPPSLKLNPSIYSTQQGYNHIKYEMWLLRNTKYLIDYSNMIIDYLESHYIRVRTDGDKCMIYASSIPMCTYLSLLLKYRYPKYKIGRYVEDDSYDNVIESDIVVSTVLSSGTAFDIPNLITVLQTIAISSSQTNLQNSGRLRRLEGKDVRFVYFYCMGIDKHVHYHFKRKGLLSEEAISYDTEIYFNSLGSTYPKLHGKAIDPGIPETVIAAYSMAKYIISSFPGVISKIKKEIDEGKVRNSKQHGWKLHKLRSKEDQLRKAEDNIDYYKELVERYIEIE